MSDRKFNTVPVKNTIVPADVVIVVDSEDSQKLKQVPATAFVGATGPQGPQGEPWVVVDATSLVKGVIQLAGDLGGTSASPTVPGLATKQDTLVSGTNIKTVNGETILGSGNLEVSAGSGGYAANVYLQSTASTTVPAYKALSYVPEVGTSTITAVANDNEVLLGTFLYDADVGTTIVDAGEWGFHFHAQVSTSAGDSFLRFEPFKRTSGGIETVLFTTTSPEISNTAPATVSDLVTQSSFATNNTDRLGIKVYASTTHNANVTFTVTVGDGNASYFNTPLAIRHSQLRARDASDSHPSSAISYDNAVSLLSATDVKGAIDELAAEKIQEPTNAYATGYVLTWNGTDWVGSENTPAVGSASTFYLDSTATVADNLALSTSPSTFPETTINAVADADIGWGITFFERYVSGPLGRTSIPAGNWNFSTFANVSSVTGANYLHTRINSRHELTGMTATFTGTGTTRTLTVTGWTPFVAGDANASILAATLVETPNQTCWISGFTSSSEVTVTVTDAGYVNETNTPLSALYYRLFLASSADIAATGIQEFTYSTTQPEFTGLNPTDRIVAAYFCQTDSVTARTFTLYYGGTERFSSFESPIKTSHSDLVWLAWASSGHTGTANKLAGFGASGEAVYVDVPSGGGGPSPVLTYSTSGIAIAGKVASVRLSQACTFSKLAVSLGVLPVGGNFEVNVKKNGTTILSGNLTITTTETASNSYYTVITGDSGKATIATTTAVAEDVITCELIAGSGNTFLGADVNILLTGTLS